MNTRKRLFFPLSLALILAACGDDVQPPSEGDGAIDDFGGSDAEPGPTLPTPTVTSPADEECVLMPVTITGTGEPGADVIAHIYIGNQTACTPDESGSSACSEATDGETRTEVGGDGEFEMDVTYLVQDNGTVLTIVLRQELGTAYSDDAVLEICQGGPPGDCTITSPQTDDKVASPLSVTGTGQAGSDVWVRVLDSGGSLTSETDGAPVGPRVLANGVFEAVVTYDSVGVEDELTVEVTLRNDFGESDPCTVSVTQAATHVISGSVFQPEDGATNPDGGIYIWLYDDELAIINPVAKTALRRPPAHRPVMFDPPDNRLNEGDFELPPVPDGTYYIRAFRDVGGPLSAAPDDLPSMSSDPQSVAVEVVVDGGDVTVDPIRMDNPVEGVPTYKAFNAYTLDTGAGSNSHCREFVLIFRAGSDDDVRNLTAPTVWHPDGRAGEVLLDDGDCEGSNVFTGSFDLIQDDGQFTWAIVDPGEDDVGEYRFGYRYKRDDRIHIEADAIDNLVRLPLSMPTTSPTGAAAARPRDVIEWAAVDGASYDVTVTAGEFFAGNDAPLTTSSFEPSSRLPDNAVVRVTITAYDRERSEVGDYDATNNGSTSVFFVDRGGDSSIEISGSIQNDLAGLPSDIHIRALSEGDGDGDTLASIVLPPDATEYTLVVPRSDDAVITLEGFIDVDQSDSLQTEGNLRSRRELRNVPTSGDTGGWDFTFVPSLITLEPPCGSEAVGTTPVFRWEPFESALLGPDGWVYVILIDLPDDSEDGPDSLPAGAWAFDNDVTEFNMADPPGAEDVVDGVSALDCLLSDTFERTDACFMGGRCEGGAGSQSLTDLSEANEWEWSVLIIECDFEDYRNNVDDNDNCTDDFSDCFLSRALAEEPISQSDNCALTVD
jgi:hypothetical protein